MKKLFIFIALVLMGYLKTFAGGQSFTVNSNTSWSTQNYNVNAGISSTFTIASGATLTVDQSGVSCYACTFSGGTITLSQSFTCQSCSFSNETITMSNETLNLQSSTNTFSSVTFTISGTAEINASAALSITGSTFTFNNSAELYNNGGQLTISASTLKFNNSSYLLANAGPVNLENNSIIFVGNGLTSSTAYIKMNGPSLNIYDGSGIALGNTNNYYFNWSSYFAATSNSSVSTYPNTINCGGTNPNSCQSPLVYGPESVSSVGLGSFGVLAVTLTNFDAELADETVELSWATAQETNSNYFEVERSSDDSSWEDIGKVEAKQNSTNTNSYHFIDSSFIHGANYYRLKIVDMESQYSYSDIRMVRGSASANVNFFPNPAVTVVNVSFGEAGDESRVQLMNMTGQILQDKKIADNSIIVSFDVTPYPRGIYLIRVVNTDGSFLINKLSVAH